MRRVILTALCSQLRLAECLTTRELCVCFPLQRSPSRTHTTRTRTRSPSTAGCSTTTRRRVETRGKCSPLRLWSGFASSRSQLKTQSLCIFTRTPPAGTNRSVSALVEQMDLNSRRKNIKFARKMENCLIEIQHKDSDMMEHGLLDGHRKEQAAVKMSVI